MFLASRKGRRFLNIAYSWGAAVVILGALFKLLHFPFGNQMLFIGMMTEFFVFFISGLEKPEEQYKWEQVYPELLSYNPLDREEIEERRKYLARKAREAKERLYEAESEESWSPKSEVNSASTSEKYTAQVPMEHQGEPVSSAYPSENSHFAKLLPEVEVERLSSSLQRLHESVDRLTQLSETAASTMQSCQQLASSQQGISEETEAYHTSLTSLNRTMESLSKIYESQLKDITGQVQSIEEINDRLDNIRYAYQESQLDSDRFRQENAQMLYRIKELNAVYARLLEAMTVNMPIPSYRDSGYFSTRERVSHSQYDRYAEDRHPEEGRRPSENDHDRYAR